MADAPCDLLDAELACDLLDAELALDRLEAELARELPGHLRGFAAACASGAPAPPPPAVARHPRSLASIRQALAHPVLADRALALARIVYPIAIDDDPRVVHAQRADPTWEALATLAAARDTVACERFARPFIELMQRLHGSPREPHATAAELPPPLAAWHAPTPPLAHPTLAAVWDILAARHGARGTLRIIAGTDGVRPRAITIEPGAHVDVVVPRVLGTPAQRFAALHELGHGLAALAATSPGVSLPRVVDEAVAAYIARLIEAPDLLPAGWYAADATAARSRRTAVARTLAAIEQALPAIATPPTERPPWALWHDPGAQTAYVDAEVIADRWWAELGPTPGAGDLARAIAAERLRVDGAIAL